MFKPGTIESWFPQNIYCADEVLIDELPYFEEFICNDLAKANSPLSKELNVLSNHSSDGAMLDQHEAFGKLKSVILKHAANFCRMIGYAD